MGRIQILSSTFSFRCPALKYYNTSTLLKKFMPTSFCSMHEHKRKLHIRCNFPILLSCTTLNTHIHMCKCSLSSHSYVISYNVSKFHLTVHLLLSSLHFVAFITFLPPHFTCNCWDYKFTFIYVYTFVLVQSITLNCIDTEVQLR